MSAPTPQESPVVGSEPSIAELIMNQGLSRRAFVTFCAAAAAGLALPSMPYADRIAEALTTTKPLPVLWLNGQDCNGNIEAFLRTTKPTPTELLLEQISINYVELLSAAAGTAAEKARADVIAAGGYVLIIEGSIPTGSNGAYCTVGGKAFSDIVKEAAAKAIKVISVGNCASWGGVPGAHGGITGAQDVPTFLGTATSVLRLPGCPVSAENIVNTIIHYVTFGEWPATNEEGLPLFAYGTRIHKDCPRLPHLKAGRRVKEWGDEGHQKGWCLIGMGCKGPQAFINCATVQFNGKTSFPINSGAPCIGCSNKGFWDEKDEPHPAPSTSPTANPTGTPTTPAPTTSVTPSPTPTATPSPSLIKK